MNSPIATEYVWQLKPQREGCAPITLAHDFLVGRDPTCDLTIDEKRISRRHASFLFKHELLFVRDQQSVNGTFVNDQRVDIAELKVGDKVRFDREEYQVERVERPKQAVAESLAQGRVLLDRVKRPAEQGYALFGQSEPVQGRTFALQGEECSVGRGEGADIVIQAPVVSSRHAVLRRRGIAWMVVDNQSSNGTRVNGQPVDKAVLRPGDSVSFGNVELRFDALKTP